MLLCSYFIAIIVFCCLYINLLTFFIHLDATRSSAHASHSEWEQTIGSCVMMAIRIALCGLRYLIDFDANQTTLWRHQQGLPHCVSLARLDVGVDSLRDVDHSFAKPAELA